jgi:hypothetical protein
MEWRAAIPHQPLFVVLLAAVTHKSAGYLYAHNKKNLGVGVCAVVGIKEGESRSRGGGR